MAIGYYKAVTQNFMMPGGGLLNCGEIAGLDPTNPSVAAAIASGILASSGAPSAPSAPVITRVKMSVFLAAGTPIYTPAPGPITYVGACPTTLDPGDIIGLPAAMAAAMIANNQAVAN